MDDELTDSEIWWDAKKQGIILVPWQNGPNNSIICAAIKEDDLEEACKRVGLDSDSWDDIYSLGLGFFVNTSVPGNGDTRKEAYINALKAFEENPPEVQWKP